MSPITRPTFLDQLLDNADLAAVAEMWRGWYILFHTGGGLAPDGAAARSVRLGVEVAGFAKRETAEVTAALLEALGGAAAAETTLQDGDTLLAQTTWSAVATPADVTPWTRALALPQF